jgi:hypothetical protein
MADRKPLKVLPDGGGDSTGLSEFRTGDTIGVANGGTGLTTVATSNLLTGNGADPLSAEANLTFDGTHLNVNTGAYKTTGSTSTYHVFSQFFDSGKGNLQTGAGTAGAYVATDNWDLNFATNGLGSAGTEPANIRMKIRSTGHIQTGYAATAPVTINTGLNALNGAGLTIMQDGHDDEILTFKSSDVAHGRVAISQTDTYGYFKKSSATLGGLYMGAVGEDAALEVVMQTVATGGTAQTTKTTAGVGLVDFLVQEHDGSNNPANVTANGNVFSVRARVSAAYVARFLVDEDGDMYSATSGQTFDAHDDLALVNNYDVIRSDMAEWNVEHEAELVRLGVLGDTVANGGMTNVTQLQRLHNGAIRQLGEQNNALQLELDEMKQQLFMLQERN